MVLFEKSQIYLFSLLMSSDFISQLFYKALLLGAAYFQKFNKNIFFLSDGCLQIYHFRKLLRLSYSRFQNQMYKCSAHSFLTTNTSNGIKKLLCWKLLKVEFHSFLPYIEVSYIPILCHFHSLMNLKYVDFCFAAIMVQFLF